MIGSIKSNPQPVISGVPQGSVLGPLLVIFPIPGINIGDYLVPISKEVCNFGAMFDKHLTMSCHVNKICRSASLALRNIGRVRKYLNQQSKERLVHAFITTRLDYCNSLLYMAYQQRKLTSCNVNVYKTQQLDL